LVGERASCPRYDHVAKRLYVTIEPERRFVFLDVPLHVAQTLDASAEFAVALEELVLRRYAWIELGTTNFGGEFTRPL
jgi:hypothetical protein